MFPVRLDVGARHGKHGVSEDEVVAEFKKEQKKSRILKLSYIQ